MYKVTLRKTSRIRRKIKIRKRKIYFAPFFFSFARIFSSSAIVFSIELSSTALSPRVEPAAYAAERSPFFFLEIFEISRVIITADGIATKAASVWERMMAMRPRIIEINDKIDARIVRL